MIESLKNMLSDSDFGLEELLPDLGGLEALLTTVLRWAVVLGPLCLLGMGLWLFLASPKEANHSAGYRFYWGMSSVESWQFTQRLAGSVWSVLGLILTIVMAIQTAGYAQRSGEELFTAAIVALLWEIGLVLGSCIAIDITVVVCFDRKGVFRFTKQKK